LGWTLGELAHKKCKEKADLLKKNACGLLQQLVEETFDTQGSSIQAAFMNSYTDVAKVAQRADFLVGAEQVMNEIIQWMIENKNEKFDKLKEQYLPKFFKWFAEVLKEADRPGSGNLNPNIDIPSLRDL